jgi:hypothetical protein
MQIAEHAGRLIDYQPHEASSHMSLPLSLSERGHGSHAPYEYSATFLFTKNRLNLVISFETLHPELAVSTVVTALLSTRERTLRCDPRMLEDVRF